MSTTGPLPSPSAVPREKKCHDCGRTFARSEHLIRHQRTHTKERPFRCPHCHRSFQRSDVKAAHVRTCPDAPSTPQNGADETSPPRKRVRVACETCRKRKMRCDGNDPCRLCQSLRTACNYASNAKSPGRTSGDRGGTNVPEAPDNLQLDLTADTVPSIVQFSTSDVANATTPPEYLLDHADHGATGGQVESGFLYDNESFTLDDPIDATFQDSLWDFPNLDQYWFDNNDPYSHEFPLFDFQSPNHALASPLQTLTSRMQQYFQEKSRPPSPSLDKVNKMWYSRPPNFESHDKTILAIFLALFRRHIAPTFTLFKNSSSDSRETSVECVLAMAALGGTFCLVQGSAEVGRSLYNDARRLLLASFNQPLIETHSPHHQLMMVKTFILLNLYGMTSGDKRSFEFAEAFHGNLADAIRAYVDSIRGDSDLERNDQDLARLKETLYILDIYRVSIMFRPPAMVWRSVPESRTWAPGAHDRFELQQHVDDLIGAAECIPKLRYPLSGLASLAPFLWPAMYPRQNQYHDDNIQIESLLLAKSDFAAQALNRWRQQNTTLAQRIDPMHMVMWHTMCLLLHANMSTLQTYAHSSLGAQTRDTSISAVAKEVNDWISSRHYQSAQWHAEQVLSMVEEAFATTKRDATQRNASRVLRPNLAESRVLAYEAPHVPYAIYFAALVLWCGITLGSQEAGTAQNQAPIARAEKLLRLHKIHVAQLLASVLNDIK